VLRKYVKAIGRKDSRSAADSSGHERTNRRQVAAPQRQSSVQPISAIDVE
jgi:hypothetical protein